MLIHDEHAFLIGSWVRKLPFTNKCPPDLHKLSRIDMLKSNHFMAVSLALKVAIRPGSELIYKICGPLEKSSLRYLPIKVGEDFAHFYIKAEFSCEFVHLKHLFPEVTVFLNNLLTLYLKIVPLIETLKISEPISVLQSHLILLHGHRFNLRLDLLSLGFPSLLLHRMIFRLQNICLHNALIPEYLHVFLLHHCQKVLCYLLFLFLLRYHF